MVRLPPGSRIGRFDIKSLIGTGGMGTLYLARDTSPTTYRLVALKLLNANLDSEDLRDRFAREARALASLSHPNVVSIHETGEYQGAPYIVMEYVRGETLAEKIKRKAPLTLTQKLKLMMELCAGLAHAHESGIIHRDIKPANLMVDPEGRLRLLDFGIARVGETGVTFAGVSMTQINVRIGTPGYMSPEQYEGAAVDRRSDIFAVGAVFYELLAYREAFPGASTRQIEQQVLEAEPPRLGLQMRDLDPDVDAVVAKALRKDPNQRFQDAGEMERALAKVWWRLGPAASGAVPIVRPAPRADKRASKADIALQRARTALSEGAPEAARRYAIEALAEDERHDGARRFLQQIDPGAADASPLPAPLPPPPLADDVGIEATIVSSRAGLNLPPVASSEQTIVSAPPGRRPPPARRAPTPVARARTATWTLPAWTATVRGWKKEYVLAALAVPLVLAGAIWLAMLAVERLSAPAIVDGQTLTISRPSNGTIVTDDGAIRCGTRGNDCSEVIEKDTLVALRLEPDEGYLPSGYSGDCAATGHVRMSAGRACGAIFVRVPEGLEAPASAAGGDDAGFTLTVYPQGAGAILAGGRECRNSSGGCQWTFKRGELVDLEAQADKGYTFQRFNGEACDADGRVVMDAPKTCGAVFALESGVPGAVAGRTGSTSGPGGTQGATTGTAARGKPAGATTKDPRGSGGIASGAGASAGAAAGATGTPDAPAGNNSPQAPLPPAASEPVAPDVEAKKEIAAALEKFRQAYVALNYQAIRSVWPKAPPAWDTQLDSWVRTSLKFGGEPNYLALDTDARTARLEVEVAHTYVRKLDPKKTEQGFTKLAITLSGRTANNNWIIESVGFQK